MIGIIAGLILATEVLAGAIAMHEGKKEIASAIAIVLIFTTLLFGELLKGDI